MITTDGIPNKTEQFFHTIPGIDKRNNPVFLITNSPNICRAAIL
jgi:hypothetical protein